MQCHAKGSTIEMTAVTFLSQPEHEAYEIVAMIIKYENFTRNIQAKIISKLEYFVTEWSSFDIV